VIVRSACPPGELLGQIYSTSGFCNLYGLTMEEMDGREIVEMVKMGGGDEGAILVAARRTATLGRYRLMFY
jgi:hypothetical protein